MSIRWMTVVWDKAMDVKGTPLVVLLCLADHAQDETGAAWPSVARIAQRTRVSERAVQSALNALEEKGYIAREMRPGHSTMYRLLAPVSGAADSTPEESAPPTSFTTGGEASFTTGVKPASPITVREPPVETPLPSVRVAADTVSDSVPDWVKKIEWMNPDKFTMACELAHHVDVVATLGHYVAWSDEHSAAQSYTRFWAWLAKAEAAARAAKDDEDVNVRLMRTVRAQQREQQV